MTRLHMHMDVLGGMSTAAGVMTAATPVLERGR
jgi:hypothetical protein